MNAQSVGKGQDFGVGSVLFSVSSLSSIDNHVVTGLWLCAGKQSVWRQKKRNMLVEMQPQKPSAVT